MVRRIGRDIEARKKYSKAYYIKNKEHHNNITKRYYELHKEEILKKQHSRYNLKTNDTEDKFSLRKTKLSESEILEHINKSQKKWRDKIRISVLSHYSNGVPKCECCGEQHIEFLCIDHINGGGGNYRRENPGKYIYYVLRKSGYPDGYRVLCHNCNLSLGFYGYCPHNTKI